MFKKILIGVTLIILLGAAACGTPTPSNPNQGKPATEAKPTEGKVISTETLIQNAVNGKYKYGDRITVSGVVKEIDPSAVGIIRVYLNPPYNVYIVVVKFPKSGENAKRTEDFRVGQEIVVRGEFYHIVEGTFSYAEVTLINCTLIEKAP